MEFRPAVAGDWEAVWSFLHRVFAAGDTYTDPPDTSSADARSRWLPEPPWRSVVVVDDDRVVGIAKFGPVHPGAGSHVANASFVVDPDHGGRGVGRALGRYVLDQAAAAGFEAMQFNAVVETNQRAVELWTSLGFEILTTVPGAFRHPEHGPVGLHIMHRRLRARGDDEA